MQRRERATDDRRAQGDAAWRFGAFAAETRGVEARRALELWRASGPGVIADVGCADGALAFPLMRQGDRLVGVDLDRARLRAGQLEAQRRGVPAAYVEADAVSLPLRTASADVVLLYEILELVRDPEAVVREAARILRPGGVAYLVAPNPLSPITLVDDPHAHLPLTHLLPRRLARWYAFSLMRRDVQELGEHFSLPSWGRLQRAFAKFGMRLHLLSNLTKVEHPELVLTPRRRRLAELLRRTRFLDFARTPPGQALVRLYDRYLARSWAFVATKPSSTEP